LLALKLHAENCINIRCTVTNGYEIILSKSSIQPAPNKA
jgi:hypothetical protein